jgi:hypothetical protein
MYRISQSVEMANRDGAAIMQRPTMNPTFLEDDAPAQPPSKRRMLRLLFGAAWRVVRLAYRVMTYDPLARRMRLRIEDGTPIKRFVRGFAYRVAFVPVLFAGITCLIVYTATHPHAGAADRNPPSFDVYYEPVTFLSSDSVSLDALLFPALEAKQVVAEREKALRKRSPAVVLVHDFAATKQQMLPLVRPLHDAGFVVLAVNTRGNGASGAVGQTYGLREALDVKAAVEMLRRRGVVDPSRIAVVAAGTGATAALIDAKQDNAIAALVLADPLTRGLEGVLDGRLGPPQEYLGWLRPLCKWTFEIAYRVDADELDWDTFKDVLENRPTLIIGEDGKGTDVADERNVRQIKQFLTSTVMPKDSAAPVARVEK